LDVMLAAEDGSVALKITQTGGNEINTEEK
jgi:hypothetical protein